MKKDLIKIISLLIITLIVLLAVLLTASQIYYEYRDFQEVAQNMRHDYVEQQKALIKSEIERVKHQIQYERNRTEDKLKSEIKSRVSQAYKIVEFIYNKHKYSKTKQEILNLVKDALYPIRFTNDTNYYFMMNSKGYELFNPVYKNLEGTNLLQSPDSTIRKEVSTTLDYFSQGNNEGYFKAYWFKSTGKKNKKYAVISYLRRFEPYGWFIGTSEFVADVEKSIQQELLNQISNYRFGTEGYIFVNTYEGRPLISNGKRIKTQKKLWEEFGPNVKKVFDMELIAAQKKEGDFIYYTWEKLTSNTPTKKTSFIYGIPEWGWIIGAGVYLDEIEKNIEVLYAQLKGRLYREIIRNLIIVLLIVITMLVIRSVVVRRIRAEINVFNQFFKEAAHLGKPIDLDLLTFSQFYRLAKNANKMLQDKLSAEGGLLKEREYLSVTLQSIGEGVIATDMDGKIVSLNQEAERLTEYTLDKKTGAFVSEIFSVIHPNTREKMSNPVQSAMGENKSESREMRGLLISQTGKEYYIEFKAASLKDGNNQIIGTILFFRDISEKLRAEEEIFKSKKLESIGVLAGGIAHDFNNLLAGVFGNISLAKLNLSPDDKIFRYITSAEKAIERATGLTKQLLTFAKGGDPVKEEIHIGPFIKDIADFSLRGSNIKLDWNIYPDLWNIRIDKGQFSQVISNLILNAKQAMASGGTLNISISNCDQKNATFTLSGDKSHYVKIVFEDQGSGIPQKYINKIFDPYFTTKNEGSGLGLAMVHSIIQKHGGYIEVESKVDIGTTFTIYIPVSNNNMMFTSEATVPQDKSPSSILTGRILLMDDEELVRETGQDMLQSLGYQVEVCENGECAIEKYKSEMEAGNKYDIVLMDLTIPGGIGGKEAVSEILKIDPEAKVIVSSGYSTDPVMANYLEYGFKGVIEKPYLIESLSKVIQEIIST